MSSERSKYTVLVTGGSGYIAGWTIIRLLNDGHRVRATLRDLARAPAVKAILSAHAPTSELSFHQVNLLADDCWAEATKGADQMLHMASPMPVREYRNQDLVPAAREGTRRAFDAAAKANISHVVLTLSTAASSATVSGATDERFWTDLSNAKASNYSRAKKPLPSRTHGNSHARTRVPLP